jgi:hypothetical protein
MATALGPGALSLAIAQLSIFNHTPGKTKKPDENLSGHLVGTKTYVRFPSKVRRSSEFTATLTEF